MRPRKYQPETFRMIYFKAPRVHAVSPYVVPPRMEVVEMITHGTVFFPMGGQELKLGCGALFWHLAGEETVHRTDPDSPYECFAAAFPAPARPRRCVPRLSMIPDHLRVRELSHELLRAYHNDAFDRKILENYARQRLLWEAHQGNILHAASTRPAPLEAALRYIESEFRRPDIGVRDLAGAGAVSEPHLHALFRIHLQQTPYHALVSRRIQEAKWLLSGTSHTIKSLSAECGFLNVETFYRAFHRLIGMTPHEFRKRHSTPL